MVRKLARGLKPDLLAVGEGVHEVRIDYRPCYRVYFGNDSAALIILLLCGDKRTQAADIEAAKALWVEYRTRKSAPPLVRDSANSAPLSRPDDEEEQ